MTETSYPWQGTVTGDAGPYSHIDWGVAWGHLHNSPARIPGNEDAGVLQNSAEMPGFGLQASPTAPASGSIDIGPGAALVDGTLYLSDDTENIVFASNASGSTRIDTVVLRKNYTAQTIRLAVVQGTPAATPVPPTLTRTAGTLWEVPLVDVVLVNAYTSIAQADISPRYAWAGAAGNMVVRVLNNYSEALQTGDVVVWDPTEEQAVTALDVENYAWPAGVWQGYTEPSEYGNVLIKGVTLVRMGNSAALGATLKTGGTAKQAHGMLGSQYTGNLGILLEPALGADTYALAFIDPRRSSLAYAKFAYTTSVGVDGETYAAGSDVAVNLNTVITNENDIGVLASKQVTVRPGVYKVTGSVLARGHASSVSRIRTKVFGVSGSITGDLLVSINMRLTTGTEGFSTVTGVLRINNPTVLELRIRTTFTTQAPVALNIGSEAEIWATLEFEELT